MSVVYGFGFKLVVCANKERDSGVSFKRSKVSFSALKKTNVRGSRFLLFGGRARVIVSLICIGVKTRSLS